MTDVLEDLHKITHNARIIGDQLTAVTVPVALLERLRIEIEHLRSLAGAVSRGESHADIRAKSKE